MNPGLRYPDMKTTKYLHFRHTAGFNVTCVVYLNSETPQYGIQCSQWSEQGADSRDTAGIEVSLKSPQVGYMLSEISDPPLRFTS